MLPRSTTRSFHATGWLAVVCAVSNAALIALPAAATDLGDSPRYDEHVAQAESPAGSASAPARAAGSDPDAPAVGEAYVDQLIDEALAEEELLLIEEERFARGVGRESLVAEYRAFVRDPPTGDVTLENGIGVFWRRETISYGRFSIDALGKHVSDGEFLIGEEGFGGSLTLRQQDFALTESWLMDNALGDTRAFTHPLISASYRFSLPTSIIRGATSRVFGDAGDLRVTAGRLGRREGISTPTFEETGENLLGLGYVHAPEQGFGFGLQGFALDDALRGPDHESVAGALQYAGRAGRNVHQLRTLADSRGNWGHWYDGDTRIGRWRHRYGLFRFEPGLRWTDVRIVDDRQGLYWRGQTRSFRRDWTAGVDLEETNIENDAQRVGRESVRLFANTAWRVRHRTSIGGTANATFNRPGSGLPADSTDSYRLSVFLSRGLAIGQSRFQATFGDTESGAASEREYGLTWDQEWAVPGRQRLNTTLAWERREPADEDVDRLSVQGSYSRSLAPGLDADTSVSFVHVDGDLSGDSRQVNVNVGLFWQFHRRWTLSLSGTWGRIAPAATGIGGSSVIDRRVFLTLRRTFERGSPPVVLGRPTGQRGTGRLVGRVFFDENRDGRWTPDESVARNLTVFLDRGFTAETDAEGRFEFWPVSAGEHSVFVALQDVPLPWGLEDETPRRVEIGVRERTVVDIPLVRLDEL